MTIKGMRWARTVGWACLCVCALAAGGCAKISPNPTGTAIAAISDTDLAEDRAWWRRFGDSDLDELLAAGATGNLDLANMAARLKIVEESLALSRKDALPRFSAVATGTIGEAGREDFSRGIEDYDTTLQMSWELDIWGRLKEKTAAQLAEYQATQADLKAAYLSLVSNIGRSYVRLRQFDEQTRLHEASIDRNRGMLRIYQERARLGRGMVEQLRIQEAEVLRLASELEELKRQRAVEENLLSELVGQGPGAVTLDIAKLSEVMTLVDVSKDLDTTLLEARPDLIALDARVKEAYHLESAAQAARMPRVSFGAMATRGVSPGRPATWAASILPQITFPGLDPATKTDLRVKQVEIDIAENNYRIGANTALAEAANAYLSHASHLRQFEIELLRLGKLEEAHEKVVYRFKAGAISQLEVLESERQMLGSQQTKLGQTARLHQDVINLYVALGRGW